MFCLRRVRWLVEFLRWQDRGEMDRGAMLVGGKPPIFNTPRRVSGKEKQLQRDSQLKSERRFARDTVVTLYLYNYICF